MIYFSAYVVNILFDDLMYCGRQWPAAYINLMKITHQFQVKTEPNFTGSRKKNCKHKGRAYEINNITSPSQKALNVPAGFTSVNALTFVCDPHHMELT